MVMVMLCCTQILFLGQNIFGSLYGENVTLWPSIVDTAILVGGFSLKILEEWGEGGMYEREELKLVGFTVFALLNTSDGQCQAHESTYSCTIWSSDLSK